MDNQTYAPGTASGQAIIPLAPQTQAFERRALDQPPNFRAWWEW